MTRSCEWSGGRGGEEMVEHVVNLLPSMLRYEHMTSNEVNVKSRSGISFSLLTYSRQTPSLFLL